MTETYQVSLELVFEKEKKDEGILQANSRVCSSNCC
jgi:hypothetical protein